MIWDYKLSARSALIFMYKIDSIFQCAFETKDLLLGLFSNSTIPSVRLKRYVFTNSTLTPGLCLVLSVLL